MSARTIRRWGDNDRNLGPFTFAFRERWRHFAMLISSGDDEYPGGNIRISAFGNTMIVCLPKFVLRPYVGWHDLGNAEWAKPGPDGRRGYVEIDRREYGFTISEGHLSVRLGRQTNDSSTTQDWGCFLPWSQWRHTRHSMYGLGGEHFWTDPKDRSNWRAWLDAKEACPSVSFEFDDFDGERIVAKTIIDEREWKFGTGWFQWLSLFRRPKIRRSLDIDFSAETGERKGSWKGGTVGHSIDMLPGELHETAFRRYCLKHKMTFVGL